MTAAPDSVDQSLDPSAWLAEQEHAIHRLRCRVAELERDVARGNDVVIPQTVIVASLFALPLIFCLPWLTPSGDTRPATGWMLLLGPMANPIPTSTVFAVVTAMLLQSTALISRSRLSAGIAMSGCALASVTMVGFIVTAIRDPVHSPAAGPLVCIGVLLIATLAWTVILYLLRD